jgi:hypothetical protein
LSGVGDSHKGPLITRKKTLSSQNNKNAKRTHESQITPQTITARQQEPMAQETSAAQQAAGPGTPRAKLHLARGAQRRNIKTPPRSRAEMPPRAKLCLAQGSDAPSSETLPRSRTGRPLGRDSASLKGWTNPWAGLRLAQGSRGSAAPAPTPPTGALNALTRRRRPGQGRIPATPTL